jgi:hypothetical protein
LLRTPRTGSRAGRSARAQFNAQRWKTLRQNWRDWFALLAIGVACVAAIVVLHGVVQLLAAGLLGASVMVGLFGWLIGDIYSLPWMWGSVGECQTAGVLEGLDRSWICEHDLERERGNWDHVVVGAPDVFIRAANVCPPHS